MKARVLGLDGKKGSEVTLPKQFSADVNKELIKRAVQAIQSAGVQNSFPKPEAGRANTAEYIGARHKPNIHRTINVGHARKPRLKNRRGVLSGHVASIPAVVGGPRAHPPKPNKEWEEKINKKEKRQATESAIAATGKKELVKERGHKFGEKLEFPIIVEAKLENLTKTKDIRDALKAIDIYQDVEKALSKRQLRPGKGKKRGRKYKKRKSVLIVVENPEKVYKAARNLEGVDIISAVNINADLLAPGTLPGRLTLWSENAIKELAGEKKETKTKEKAKVEAKA
ncbi:MAG: 50S ribosomal protein L4 [Candidatus Diapherotrites archaeon]|uniref:50S ribosomal protein L4 n=1 Tax=Candidatus Iainarchaeum sp. TaxID=3101447 RepID=A0A2D6LPD9_9ARCH|nr:50S ribosomal protein L4 [Candidatus Diapherotrites archaeon]|tara:strand:+ start:2596 stop:3447 length:852 start_codon:yes stop_codon:yes gene_type:complete